MLPLLPPLLLPLTCAAARVAPRGLSTPAGEAAMGCAAVEGELMGAATAAALRAKGRQQMRADGEVEPIRVGRKGVGLWGLPAVFMMGGRSWRPVLVRAGCMMEAQRRPVARCATTAVSCEATIVLITEITRAATKPQGGSEWNRSSNIL